MKKDRRLLLLGLACPLLALAACASLAGIEAPAPGDDARDDRDDGTGAAGADGLGVSPDRVEITSTCAGEGESKFVTLSNKTGREAPYELEVPEGAAFALRDPADASASKLAGTLAAGEDVRIYLRVIATKAGTSTAPLRARVGGQTTQVTVTVKVEGGALEFWPALVDFGDVRYNKPSPTQTVQLKNVGTEPVNVIAFGGPGGADAGSDFQVNAGAGSIPLEPNAMADIPVALAPGEPGSQVTAYFEPQTETPTCGAPPKLTLKGKRVNEDVTVNPVSINFNDVDCGSGGMTRTIVISNFSATAVPFEATTNADARYALSVTSGSVPAASGGTEGKTSIVVTLKPVNDLGPHADKVDIKVSPVGGEKTTTVSVAMRTVGGLLVIDPAERSFGPGDTKSFTVKNVGNKFIYGRHASSNTSAFQIVNNTSEGPLFPDIARRVDVKFVASPDGAHSARVDTTRINTPPQYSLIYPSSGQLCATAPSFAASGTK
ncbi:MAG: choice-of-anchor D domain-containing protein [Labilithrix sp.]|nr:choice-of-anchor D domain-containing protein [Labilithrix sp.]